ncbi:hypothetical protein ACFE04_025136 [Oxalis oulophora]
MAVDKIDIPGILEISELQVENIMADDKIDIVESPVAFKLQSEDIMAEKLVDVHEILDNSEPQVGDIVAEKTVDVPEISENSEFEGGDVMAEEKIDSPEIPENSELEIVEDTKRFSTGHAGFTNKALNVRSRYLKGKMGSCHDLCKHGIRNAAEEENSRSPKIKRSVTLKTVRESIISAARNKNSKLDRKNSPDVIIITSEGNAMSQKLEKSITFQGLETVRGNEGLGLETNGDIVTVDGNNADLACDHSDSEIQGFDYDPSVITSAVTSLSDNITPPSKNGLLPCENIDVSSKHATSPKVNFKPSKPLSRPTPGSLKNIKVGESRKTKEKRDLQMNSAGKGKELKTPSKNVSVPPPVPSSPKRSGNKASVTRNKSPVNPLGRSNVKSRTNGSKSKSEDVAEKTSYIFESSVNASDLFPPSTSSSENKNSENVNSSTNNERTPQPGEKKSLRRTRNGTLSERKGSRQVPPLASPRYGITRTPSRRNESESNRQKVSLRKTPATRQNETESNRQKATLRKTSATRQNETESIPQKVGLRKTFATRQNETESNHQKVSLRKTLAPRINESESNSQKANLKKAPTSRLLPAFTEKKVVLRRTQFGRSSSQHGGPASQKSNLKAENKSIIKRAVAEIKDAVAQKLKFRRGKVIEPQTEIVAPRRLKFKRRVIAESILSKGGDTESRSSKKDDEDTKVEIDSIQSEESKKIMLKRQDLERKKDVEISYNNVIEETASKLVETRKSKVKALVGAFETVISLQEKKPNYSSVIEN